MTAYYAIGGGRGHATRARRVLAALGIEDAEIITTADVPQSLERNRDAHHEWVVDRFRGRHVIIDTFPAGIQGELSGLEGEIDYVARLLRWEDYRRAVPCDAPPIATTYVVEELTADHKQFVEKTSRRVATLHLQPPRVTGNTEPVTPFSLIVHSGPPHEVHELVAYAAELCSERVLVATHCDVTLPAGFEKLTTDQPVDYFPGARRIISAAGFNVMLETSDWRDKHHILPFPRRFDDQYLRAARRRHSA